MSDSFVTYHLHSEYSLLDSTTKFSEYIELAKRDGCKAIGVSEHGLPRGYLEDWLKCREAGIKLLIGCEVYLTEALEPKIRDNYHTILIARNKEGLKELLLLAKMASQDDHFYYVPRISFSEFLNISNNIIKTSACLASPLNKLDTDHPLYLKLAKHYDFLEIQPHNCSDQADFNRKLLFLSQEIGVPLIAATDTHNANQYKSECRAVLRERKKMGYADEDSFNLNWRTYDELCAEFESQGIVPKNIYLEAIENTNRMADMVEEISIDCLIKYPILYGTAEMDAEIYERRIEQMLQQKLEAGIIPKSQESAFRAAIQEEIAVFKQLGMMGFMLSMSELIAWCKEQGFAIGTARGSVGGSRVAYVTDIIDLNPEQWHTNFSRFCNSSRVEVGDIDTDCCESDRPAIFQYIAQRFGEEKTARVASYDTIADLAFIEDVIGAFRNKWDREHSDKASQNPFSLAFADKVKAAYEESPEKAQAKYPEIFYYYEGMIGTKISQSIHPAGIVIAPVNLDEEYGVFMKDGERCLFATMDDAHEIGLVKYDFLILKTVQLIRDTCKLLNRPYPRTHEIDWDDQNVWDEMLKDPVGIFQFEGDYAFSSLRQFKPHSIFDMSLVTAAIRPSGASYRDALLSHCVHHNPSKMIDDLLKDNYGYLVYQEDIIAFLQQICGLSGSDADTVRRGIARKKTELLEAWLPKILNGYCEKSDKDRLSAEIEAREFLKVIEDASAYMFGYNHSIAYCLLGYMCAYFRCYHPVEFMAAALNIFSGKEEKTAAIMQYLRLKNVQVMPPKFGHSSAEYRVEGNTIYKGVASIKYMNVPVSDALFELSKRHFKTFMELLRVIRAATGINSRQLGILINLDYFSGFGNARELSLIYDWFTMFKEGEMKTVKKSGTDQRILDLVSKHATDIGSKGAVLKSYTITDMPGLLEEAEQMVKGFHLKDYTLQEKARQQLDTLGYIDIVTNKNSDRRRLFVMNMYPMKSKRDNTVWGYAVLARSIGSGKSSRLTVRSRVYNAEPFNKGDIIYASDLSKWGEYWYLDNYHIEI